MEEVAHDPVAHRPVVRKGGDVVDAHVVGTGRRVPALDAETHGRSELGLIGVDELLHGLFAVAIRDQQQDVDPIPDDARVPHRHDGHIGHVSLTSPEEMAPYLQAFEEGFRELGYLKGRDFIIESRSANGTPELLSAAAAELVRLNVDVILTGVNQGIVAARQATKTTPIVMVYGIDPVGAGFIQSLAHPGGNITGGTFEASPLIYGKKLEYLKQLK